MKRREGIGGVTFAVLGLVVALSVGIAATAHGGVFNEGLTVSSAEPVPAAAPEPGMALSPAGRKKGRARAAGVWKTATSTRTTTTVSVRTLVSHSAGSTTGQGGTCVIEARIVTNTPVAPNAGLQLQIDVPLATRGGQARQGIPA